MSSLQMISAINNLARTDDKQVVSETPTSGHMLRSNQEMLIVETVVSRRAMKLDRKNVRYGLGSAFLALFLSCYAPLADSAPKEKAETIGRIKWAIYDAATSQLLSNGVREKTLQRSDVEISRKNGGLYDKQIELGDHFGFGLADGVDNKTAGDGDGFGLTGDRDDVKTFSWDWFVVDRPGHATKLQESGELSFDTHKTPNGIEINRMQFLTDVSIRVARWGHVDPYNPAWRIKIFKGSTISWPVLVNGEVKALPAAPTQAQKQGPQPVSHQPLVVVCPLADNIGYVRLPDLLEHQLGSHLQEALKGCQGCNGLILDLRNNPGGLLENVAEVASLFLKSDQLTMTMIDRDGYVMSAPSGNGNPIATPMVVLIDADTSGGATALAYAFQDNGRATIVGLPSGGASTIKANLRIITASKSDLKGITPDLLVPLSTADLSSNDGPWWQTENVLSSKSHIEDKQLLKALELVKTKSTK